MSELARAGERGPAYNADAVSSNSMTGALLSIECTVDPAAGLVAEICSGSSVL